MFDEETNHFKNQKFVIYSYNIKIPFLKSSTEKAYFLV